MVKVNNNYKKYNTLSLGESKLLNAVDPCLVFSIEIVRRLTAWKSSTINNTLWSLKKKGVVTAVIKNHYVVTQQIPEHIFAIATTIVAPSYISFWTAASYYGWTEQLPKTIELISTKQFQPIKVKNFQINITTCQPYKLFGYTKIKNFTIAEKEKLVVDMLCKPELCGGMGEVMKCIQNSWKELDQQLLLRHLLQFNNKSCLARLGYCLEILKLPNALVPTLQLHLPKGFVKLNPALIKKKKYNKTWRIIINDR